MSLAYSQTAGEMLRVVPRIMRSVRNDMRDFRGHSLSVHQFRTLGYVHRNRGTTLSRIAEHIGLTLPAMSRLVDGLVDTQLLVRHPHPDDRRCITLNLTARGEKIWESARQFAQASLTKRISALTPTEHTLIAQAMSVLKVLFVADRPADPPEQSGMKPKCRRDIPPKQGNSR